MKSAVKLIALVSSAVLVFCAFSISASAASNRLPCITCPSDKDPQYKDHFILSTWNNCPYWFDYYLYYYDSDEKLCLMGINDTQSNQSEVYFENGYFSYTGMNTNFLVFKLDFQNNNWFLVDANKFGWYSPGYFYDYAERWEAPYIDRIVYCNLALIDGGNYNNIVRQADTIAVENFPFGEDPPSVYYYIYSKDWIGFQATRYHVSEYSVDSRGDPFPVELLGEYGFIPTNDPDGDYVFTGSCNVSRNDLLSNDGNKSFALSFFNQGVFVDQYLGDSFKLSIVLTQFDTDLNIIDTQVMFHYESDQDDSFHIYDAEPGTFVRMDLNLPFTVNDIDGAVLTFTWLFQGEQGLYYFPGNALLQDYNGYAQSTIINNLNSINTSIKNLPQNTVDAFINSQVISIEQFLIDNPSFDCPPQLDPAVNTSITIHNTLEEQIRSSAYNIVDSYGGFDHIVGGIKDNYDGFFLDSTNTFSWVKNRMQDVIDVCGIEILIYVLLSLGMAIYILGRKLRQ